MNEVHKIFKDYPKEKYYVKYKLTSLEIYDV